MRIFSLLFVFFLPFNIGCDQSTKEYNALYDLVLRDVLLTNPLFFPILNEPYLDEFGHKILRTECGLDLDSLLGQFRDFQYRKEQVSKEKLSSIIRNHLKKCRDSDAFTLYVRNVNLSTWGLEVLGMQYAFSIQKKSEVRYQYSKKKVLGTPYNLIQITSLDEVPSPAAEESCHRFLEISQLIRIDFDKYAIEISHGCGTQGLHRILFVVEKFEGKWMVNDKCFSNFKF